MPYKRMGQTVYKKTGKGRRKLAKATSVENANKMIRRLYAKEKNKKSHYL